MAHLLQTIFIFCSLVSNSIQQTIQSVDNPVVDDPSLWVKVLSCTEGSGSDSDSISRFTYDYDISTIQQLASAANSIKIVPSNGELNPEFDNFAVIARPDSDAVVALNDFSEISSTIDENWIGSESAKGRLSHSANAQMRRSFADFIYDGSTNEEGIHIAPSSNDCQWDRTADHGQNIEVHFGYFTKVVLTGCYGWDYASHSNSMQIQLKGSKGQSRFFFVNEFSSLPIHGRTAAFYIGVDIGTIGDLYSVVISVDDPHGYCLKELSVETAQNKHYTFSSMDYFGSGLIVADYCQYSYKSILPKAPLIRCIDDYLEVYTHTMRGIYHVNMHTCGHNDAGIAAMNMEDATYAIIMGKTKQGMSYSTTEISYLDHYKVGELNVDKLGHLIAANVFINKDHNHNNALYTRDIEGTIIGIRIEAVGRFHLDEYEHMKLNIDGKNVMINTRMTLDNGKHLVMFLDDSDRVSIEGDSTRIDIYGVDIMSNQHNVYVNVYVIFEGYNELYQLPFFIHNDANGTNWFDANEKCQSQHGTQLISIHSKDESFLLEGFLGEYKSWIGLVDFDLNGLMKYDMDYNDDWKWIDSSYAQYTNWLSNNMMNHHNDDGKDCAFDDASKYGWDVEDCDESMKIYSYTCASPYWYSDNHRKFEINVDCKVHECIHDVTLISIGNNAEDDALCIDSVSVDDDVTVDISTNWIGGSYDDSSLNAMYKYPVCKTEVVDMFVDYSTSQSDVLIDAYTLPGVECYNGNRIIESECCIEQVYALPEKTLYGVLKNGGSAGRYSWAAASKVTLSTTEVESTETSNELEFLSTHSIAYVDGAGKITNLKPHSIYPSTDWDDTQQTDLSFGHATHLFREDNPGFKTLFENQKKDYRKCEASQDVPPSHSVSTSFRFNALAFRVNVFSDLKLTLCDEFINTDMQNDESKYAYVKHVPGQIVHFEPVACNVRFDGVKYVSNKMSCYDEQQLSVFSGSKFLPRCQNGTDSHLYDGCQCNLGDDICWCSDEEGNMLAGEAMKIPSDTTWQQTCTEYLNCGNTDLIIEEEEEDDEE